MTLVEIEDIYDIPFPSLGQVNYLFSRTKCFQCALNVQDTDTDTDFTI